MDEVFAVERAMNSALRLQITCRLGGRNREDDLNRAADRRRKKVEGQALSDLEKFGVCRRCTYMPSNR